MAETEVEKSLNIIVNCNEEIDDDLIDVLINCFRSLRDYCANGKLAQTYIANNGEVIQITKTLVKKLLTTNRNNKDLCLLVALQFIANFLVENVNNQRLIWMLLSDDLSQVLISCQPKIQNCAAMIIYNILLDNNCYMLDYIHNLEEVLKLTQHEITAEYASFIIELFICKSQLIKKQYALFSDQNKLIILSIIESLQKNLNDRQFPPGCFEYLAKYVMHRFYFVVRDDHSEMDELKVIEAITILQILNSACSDAQYLKEVQSVSELLASVIQVLGAVHSLSKEKGNQFSMLLKLSEVEAMERENGVNHNPVFGFKGSLVRLIGNMCWHSKKHQDMTREMGGIPLILDCCNIDARNPFIIQWAVLTMRNLCENNFENQKAVACIDNQGQLDTSRLAQLDLFVKNSAHHN